MFRPTLFALVALPLLSACAGQLGGPPPQPAMSPSYSQSTGFTGVGFEAASVVPRQASFATPSGATASSGAARPAVKSVQARGSSISSRAVTAIRSASSRANVGTPVTVAGQSLIMNLVDVGDTRFAVLKKPRSVFVQSMSAVTNSAYVAQITALTGCSAINNGYRYGSNRARPLAIAVPLSCS